MSALYTLDSAAKELQVSLSTITRLVARSELKAIRIGRSVRVTEDELRRFIRAREADEGQPAA